MGIRYSHTTVNETNLLGKLSLYGFIEGGDEPTFLKVLLEGCSLKQETTTGIYDNWGDLWTFPGDLIFSGKVIGDFSYAKGLSLMKPEIEKVIFNDPATIVYWHDGTKTVVKAQDGEPFDKEKGLAMAFMKKVCGNKGNYFNEVKRWAKNDETD